MQSFDFWDCMTTNRDLSMNDRDGSISMDGTNSGDVAKRLKNILAIRHSW